MSCNPSQAGNFTKGNDTLDVWFDSGCSWNAVLPAATGAPPVGGVGTPVQTGTNTRLVSVFLHARVCTSS